MILLPEVTVPKDGPPVKENWVQLLLLIENEATLELLSMTSSSPLTGQAVLTDEPTPNPIGQAGQDVAPPVAPIFHIERPPLPPPKSTMLLVTLRTATVW